MTDTFAFVFDSGNLGSADYGSVVFRRMIEGGELSQNKEKMTVSLGDIITKKRFIDIETYVLNDEYCTIDFDEALKDKQFKDYPFCWIVDHLSDEIARAIDNRLKSDLPGYIGLCRIDRSCTYERKRFWRHTVTLFSLSGNTITAFCDPDNEDEFCYLDRAIQFGYNVNYSSLRAVEKNDHGEVDHGKKNRSRPRDFDRDIWALNFSLRQEFQMAGTLLWKSINALDKIRFAGDGANPEKLIEHPFFALYFAAQGVERMQKAIVELICKKHHIKEAEKTNVYDLLMSHSHVGLNNWIEKKEKTQVDKRCRKLLEILSKFYMTVRYSRFTDESYLESATPEYDLLCELHSKGSTNLDAEIKNSFGKYLGKLSSHYFELLNKLCCELRIFAYELEYDSAAIIVFGYGSGPKNLYEELIKRKHARMEVLYWLMKRAAEYPEFSEVNEPALCFDPFDFKRYLSEIIHNAEDGYACFDTVDYLYDELCTNDKDKWKARLLLIEHMFSDM